MTEIVTLLDIVKRLNAGLELVKLAHVVFPRLVADGHTTAESVAKVRTQIPALIADIEKQIQNAKHAMEAIQDRVEAVAQFLKLHRAALTADEAEQLERNLATLRG